MKLLSTLYFIFLAVLILSLTYIFINSSDQGGEEMSNALIVASVASTISMLGIIITSLIIVIGTLRKNPNTKDPSILD